MGLPLWPPSGEQTRSRPSSTNLRTENPTATSQQVYDTQLALFLDQQEARLERRRRAGISDQHTSLHEQRDAYLAGYQERDRLARAHQTPANARWNDQAAEQQLEEERRTFSREHAAPVEPAHRPPQQSPIPLRAREATNRELLRMGAAQLRVQQE